MSKSELAIMLSEVKGFGNAKVKLEQYKTDSEVAAEVLWNADLAGNIEGKTVADLGCGTGILGIGALLLGSRHVYFVDMDAEATSILKQNLEMFGNIKPNSYTILNNPIATFNKKVDLVITNPPFGTKNKGADVYFLEKAIKLSSIIISFHLASTKEFISKWIHKHKYIVSGTWEYELTIKHSMNHHTKPKKKVDVVVFRIEKT